MGWSPHQHPLVGIRRCAICRQSVVIPKYVNASPRFKILSVVILDSIGEKDTLNNQPISDNYDVDKIGENNITTDNDDIADGVTHYLIHNLVCGSTVPSGLMMIAETFFLQKDVRIDWAKGRITASTKTSIFASRLLLCR